MAGFTKAVRSQARLRAAIDGPSGAGKTFTALRLAFALKAAGLATKVAVIDTENNSASLYAGESPDDEAWDFDCMNLTQYGPDNFTAALNEAARLKFDVIVVDSLSHAWQGAGGALDLVDQKGGNKFTAWKDVTPMHRKMIDAILRSPAHVIATMRSKMEHVLEKDERGNTTVRKIGLAPIQRDGMEYEFTVYGSMDWSHQIKISKSRCSLMQDAITMYPGPGFWAPLFDWLKSAAPSDPAAFVETQPVLTPPTNSPESFRENFLAGIAQMSNVNDAKTLGDAIKEAVENQWITKAITDELRLLFQARVKALKEEPAPPVVTDDTKST